MWTDLKLTSNDCNGYKVSATSEYYPAFGAFNEDCNPGWNGTAAPGFLQILFPRPVMLRALSIYTNDYGYPIEVYTIEKGQRALRASGQITRREIMRINSKVEGLYIWYRPTGAWMYMQQILFEFTEGAPRIIGNHQLQNF